MYILACSWLPCLPYHMDFSELHLVKYGTLNGARSELQDF